MHITTAIRDVYKVSLANHAKDLLEAFDVACQKTIAYPEIAEGIDYEYFLGDTQEIRSLLKGIIYGVGIGGHDTFTVSLELMADMAEFQETIDTWVAKLGK